MSVYECAWSFQQLWFEKLTSLSLASFWNGKNGEQKGSLMAVLY